MSSTSFIKDNSLVLWIINEGQTDYSDFAVYVSNLDLKKGMTIQQVYWDSTSVITDVEKDIIANGIINSMLI